MLIPVDYFFQGAAGDVVAHVVSGTFSGVIYGAKVGLFTNQPTLTQQTLLANLTEPTFPGYAQQAITWSAVFQQPDASWAVQGGLYQFQMTDNTVPTVVYGYFLVDTGGTHLIAAEMFETPVNLPTSLQSLFVSPQVAFGNTGWGAGTVVT